MRIRRILTLAVLSLGSSMAGDASGPRASPETPSQTKPGARAAPDWSADSWAELIGIWVTDNSAYKGDADETMDAYGMEWSWGVGKKSLIGRLYGIRDGREVGTFWEFREFWHPGEGRVLAAQYGAGGMYGVGPREPPADGTSEMLQTFYDPSTGAVTRIGHRSEVKQDELTTRSFDVDEEGVWTERRTYVWHRQP